MDSQAPNCFSCGGCFKCKGLLIPVDSSGKHLPYYLCLISDKRPDIPGTGNCTERCRNYIKGQPIVKSVTMDPRGVKIRDDNFSNRVGQTRKHTPRIVINPIDNPDLIRPAVPKGQKSQLATDCAMITLDPTLRRYTYCNAYKCSFKRNPSGPPMKMHHGQKVINWNAPACEFVSNAPKDIRVGEWMLYLNEKGLDWKKIAEILDVPYNLVVTHASNFRKKLKGAQE